MTSTFYDMSLPGGATLLFLPNWLSLHEGYDLLEALNSEPWKSQEIQIMGKKIPQPRLTCSWAVDPGVRYTYSGLTIDPSPLPGFLDTLRVRLQNVPELQGASFNYILGNKYRDGKDSIGFHSDNEKELGVNPTIASLSLGGTRKFVLKHARDKSVPPVEVELTHGSLLIMAGTTQTDWVHGVPKTSKPVDTRVNLTFRKILV